MEVLRTRKNCPRLLPRLVLCDQCAPLVQPGLPRLPRESPFSELFSTPAGLKLNLRTAIYNTALAPVVDILPLNAGEKKGEKEDKDHCYQLLIYASATDLWQQLIHGTSVKLLGKSGYFVLLD